MGVTVCAVTSGLVFAINTTLTVWGYFKYSLQDGLGTIQDGHCEDTKTLNLWLHVVINGLSTLLLGASSYTMQCLVAPTRKEVDDAHCRYDWLDIGVPSMRNLTKIPRKRAVLWWSLAFSSIPLHLLYNSAVFSTLSVQEYAVFAGSAELIGQGTLNSSSTLNATFESVYRSLRNASAWEKLENAQCIKAYGHQIVSVRGDLVAISSAVNASEPLVLIQDTSELDAFSSDVTYDWICENYQDDDPRNDTDYWCDPNVIVTKHQDGNWTLLGDRNYPVQYCLSQRIKEHCKIQFSLVIMIITISCNLIKMGCMLLTLWFHRFKPLVTIGDAIVSFLQRADPATKNMCLADTEHFKQRPWKKVPSIWARNYKRWHSSTSFRRWWACTLL